jgi:ACS family hexuronate transporter-like MFS transporter
VTLGSLASHPGKLCVPKKYSMNRTVPSPSDKDESPWRWVIITLLFLGTVVNYLDRLAIPALSPVLRDEFKLSGVQYAAINAWFLVFYAASMFVWGALFDRLGNRTGFSVAVVVWSVAEIGLILFEIVPNNIKYS